MATNARVFESEDDSDTESTTSNQSTASKASRGEGKDYDDFKIYNDAQAAEDAVLADKIWSKVGILRPVAGGIIHNKFNFLTVFYLNINI